MWLDIQIYMKRKWKWKSLSRDDGIIIIVSIFLMFKNCIIRTRKKYIIYIPVTALNYIKKFDWKNLSEIGSFSKPIEKKCSWERNKKLSMLTYSQSCPCLFLENTWSYLLNSRCHLTFILCIWKTSSTRKVSV